MNSFDYSIVATGLDPRSLGFSELSKIKDVSMSYFNGKTLIRFRRQALSMQDAVTSSMCEVEANGGIIQWFEEE